jgi:hypothetical protein
MANTKPVGGTVKIATNPDRRGRDQYQAWLPDNKKFKATSTSSCSSAARNLALRHFFGTAKRHEFPDDPEKIVIKPIGNGQYEATYTP